MNFNILSLDQGTTSSRAIVFATDGTIVSKAQYDFRQLYPNPGWVEHDPFDILQSQYSAVHDAVCACSEPISCIGITNQRETVVVWEKSSGKPVYNAIVWQCRRTSSICESLCSIGYSDEIKQKTGLNID
ncbi:MAG: FGGY family carbohydrate kinase, partial [Clostridia bacterium]